MRDAEYVKHLLEANHRTHRVNENPYPGLIQQITTMDFGFLSGEVVEQRNHGEPNRDRLHYLVLPDLK